MAYIWIFSAETWALLVLFFSLLVLYGYWPHGFFQRIGVPGPKPLPFIGTMLEYKQGFQNFDLECFKKYGKVWGIYDARQPVLCIMDREILKTILIKECYSLFTNRRNFRLNGPLYDAVSIIEDDDWKRIRSVLSPSFTSGRLKEMFGIMKTHSHTLVQNLGKTSKRGEAADIKEIFGAYSMDVVTSTAFSVDIDSLNNPDDPFVTNIKKMLKFDFLNPLFVAVGNTSLLILPMDFLQLMIDSQKSEKILSQSMIFIFAGYETTSSTLSFFFYNIATNPETMKKLQQEIDQTIPNESLIQYDAVMNMDYLDAALSESLRLYPPAARLERVCKKTVEINGLTIPQNTVVLAPVFPLHRDPEYWPEPDTFKPERFTKGNKENIDPFVYMPFGSGPRNCIGMRFALVTIKLAIVEILQRFDVILSEETKVRSKITIQ
uniref:unspecific monooxygenase n=1 Tax=Astyanax mexicanus TaxID=7994 RepID=A0A8B9GV11_ASTMX